MDSDLDSVKLCELCEETEGALVKFHLDTGDDSAINDEAYICQSCHFSFPMDIEMFFVVSQKRLNRAIKQEEEEFDEMDV